VCLLIAALGGQGGGVLVEWLVAAARREGFPAQATSIPGVAQRTGATTYYFEVFPERSPPRDPVFSLYPSSGDVDLVAALEPTEAARALAQGFVGKATTVVTTRQRVFSTAEKMHAGDGTFASQPLLAALRSAAKALLEVDLEILAKELRSQANAVLLGAIAETRLLPIGEAACRAAIEDGAVAVEANLAAFEAGSRIARGAWAQRPPAAADGLVFQPPPASFADAIANLPAVLQPIAGHGVARLVDYQDEAYGRLYLQRLRRLLAADGEPDVALTRTAAHRLAAWMAFEDVIRVAQLKTRPGRLARIRAEVGIGPADPLVVHDFLKPGREELEGLLPAFLAPLLPATRARVGPGGLSLRLRTSSPPGYLAFRMLASLRRWRRNSIRFVREQQAIETWLAAILAAARRDYPLAMDTAEVAVWARGYGDVRARGMARLERLFRDWEQRLAVDLQGVAAAVREAREAAYADPDGEIEP
jgi:indolepyruvate ferredoxin oxidoreductase beta subunit